MAALGGGRSTLANQGISGVMEATPPGYYRAYAERTSRKSTTRYIVNASDALPFIVYTAYANVAGNT